MSPAVITITGHADMPMLTGKDPPELAIKLKTVDGVPHT